MPTLPIPAELAAAYRGGGHALAAIKDGRLIDLLYLRDLLSGFDPDNAESAINDVRLAPTIAHLSSIGAVSVGMVSCWEFTEL